VIEPTVHLVDDDPSFLLALSMLLRASGFRVETYTSATAFLDQSRSDEPGCVITDLRMPEVDGLDLQSALGRMPNALPILFLTGQADTASVVRAMRGGAEDFLEKTAKLEVLFEAVRQALARDQQAREERLQRQALRLRFKSISSREREVLGHILRGRLNKQIASDLGIHERTVKVHRKSIMIKLKVRSVAALARLSQDAGVFTPEPPSRRAIRDGQESLQGQ
jgi:two-component system, LuxR family, response regulator FixJ